MLRWTLRLFLQLNAKSLPLGWYGPNEYTGSAYTYTLKGANVKAKANAVQGIPKMIEIATGGSGIARGRSEEYLRVRKSKGSV